MPYNQGDGGQGKNQSQIQLTGDVLSLPGLCYKHPSFGRSLLRCFLIAKTQPEQLMRGRVLLARPSPALGGALSKETERLHLSLALRSGKGHAADARAKALSTGSFSLCLQKVKAMYEYCLEQKGRLTLRFCERPLLWDARDPVRLSICS